MRKERRGKMTPGEQLSRSFHLAAALRGSSSSSCSGRAQTQSVGLHRFCLSGLLITQRIQREKTQHDNQEELLICNSLDSKLELRLHN